MTTREGYTTLDPLRVPPDTDYTHYCGHCGERLRRLRADENRAPHRCDEEAGTFFGVQVAPELRPLRYDRRTVEAPWDRYVPCIARGVDHGGELA